MGVGAQECAGHGSEADLSEAHAAEAQADREALPLNRMGHSYLQTHRGEAVVLSHGHAWVGRAPVQVGRGWSEPALHIRGLPALGTGHILCAGVTQHLHSTGTVHTGLCKAKVQEGQHCPRAHSCEKVVSHSLSCKQELHPRARPHLWQQQSHHRPILAPGHPTEGSVALSISASSLRGHTCSPAAPTAVPNSPGPTSSRARE